MSLDCYPYHETANEKLYDLIARRQSFTLTNVTSIKQSVKRLEELIEKQNLSCRVYTAGRATTVAAAAIPVSPTVLAGWASAIAIGAHNLATFNPDYEIAKFPLSAKLEINFKK
jgi:hypothetical protein